MMRRFAIVGLALVLTACHGKQSETGKSAVAVEVLPGSASDAMIAYDTLKSQPPIAAREAGQAPAEAPITTTPSDAAPAASAAAD